MLKFVLIDSNLLNCFIVVPNVKTLIISLFVLGKRQWKLPCLAYKFNFLSHTFFHWVTDRGYWSQSKVNVSQPVALCLLRQLLTSMSHNTNDVRHIERKRQNLPLRKYFSWRSTPCITFVQYIGGCDVYEGVLIALRGIISALGGYNQCFGGISWFV